MRIQAKFTSIDHNSTYRTRAEAGLRGGWQLLRRIKDLLSDRGSQLLEFAITVPAVSLVLVGAIDYSGAFLLKHKLGNAAREVARVAVSNPMSNQNCTDATPCSIEAAADAAVQYMNAQGLSASCIVPNAPTSSGTLTWTYTCSSGISLTINRGYTFNGSDGNPVPSTQVTLSYPYNWVLSGASQLLLIGQQTNQNGQHINQVGQLNNQIGQQGNQIGQQGQQGNQIGQQGSQSQTMGVTQGVTLPTGITISVVMENLN